ncbi:MAG TPA: T9SS type A sorting domain-containing protein [Puia sp.]|nr:T9SS type A sorting domain-containing protein [Puia sp.]
MKRIIRFALPLFLSVATGLFVHANTNGLADTANKATRLTLQGNFTTFNAEYGWNYFELNWNSLAAGFDHFEIERSLDGQNFEKLGEIKASDITSGQYSFRDHFKTSVARNNDFYYRLKQVQADGSSVYSKMLIARMYNTRTLASLSVTPDPAANDILVNVQLNQDAYVMMKVLDASGNLILKEGQKAGTGYSTYSLNDTHNLQKGLYTLEVTVNSREKLVMKLAKG